MSPVVMVVPVRVSQEWFAALEQGVGCAGVSLSKSENGDYDLRLHGLQTAENGKAEPEPEKPKSTRRKKAAS